MATLQDVLSPQARIDGLTQTPVADPLAPAMLAGLTGEPRPVATGPGPGSGVKAPVAPKTPTLASRNIYGPRIYGGGNAFGRSTGASDPNAGLAPRIAALATSPAGAPQGFLASPVGSVLRSALYGLGQNLPVGAGGIGNFLGSAGRAFTSSVDAQEAQRAQSAQAAQAANEAAFQRQLQQAQLTRLQQMNDDPGTPDYRLFPGGPGQPAGWALPPTADNPSGVFKPLPGVPVRPTPTPRQTLNPLDAKYAQILQQVIAEKHLELPVFATPEAQNAEALRLMRQSYSRSPGFADWLKAQGNGASEGTDAGSNGPTLAPSVRADQLRSQGLDAAAIKAQMAKEGYRIKGVNAQ